MNETDEMNQPPDLALTRAIQYGSYAGVANALARGADVNARDENGRTALMIAVHQNLPKNTRTLIAAGADVNATDPYGDTPLHHFCQSDELDSSQDCLDILLNAGADINARNISENTPFIALMLAVRMNRSGSREGQVPVARRLIERGADVLAQGVNEITALEVLSYIEDPDPQFKLMIDHAILNKNTPSTKKTTKRARL